MRFGTAILAVLISVMGPGLGELIPSAGASDLVRIPGEVPPAVATATRVPASPSPDLSVTLTIVLNRSDQAGFDAFLRDVSDPRSPLFRRYLGQRDLADRFGPSRAAYDAVLDWLTGQGFTLVEGSANRLTLTVHGTRGRVEQVFGVRVDDYQIGDRTFYANDRDPALPARIASHVRAIVGLSNLARPVRAAATLELIEKLEKRGCGPKQDPKECTMPYSCFLAEALDPYDTIYDVLDKGLGIQIFPVSISPLVTLARYMCIADMLDMLNRLAVGLPPIPTPFSAVPGTTVAAGSAMRARAATPLTRAGDGQTIGLLEFDNFNPSDVKDFLTLIGQGDRFSQLSQVHVAGGAGPPGATESEVLLDIDTVMSLAPGAQVVVYDGPFTGRGSFQTMLNAMINDGVNIISNSWAYCEDQTTQADVRSIDSILASAAAAGITVLTGAGDQGGTCLNGSPNTIHVPAGSPHVTAVGGTTSFRHVGGTYGGETWWDSSTDLVPGGQGGFGVSRFFARPSYQDGLTASPMRSIPDVTAPADPATAGVFICQADAGGCPTNLRYGGTSMAAPIWAAIVAVMNDQQGRQLGFLNPLLYPLANTLAFHSAAEMGSDFAHVGLGSPNVGALHLALTGGTAGPFSDTASVLTAFPRTVVADGASPSGVVVALVDGAGNSVSGQAVQLAMNAGSHAVIAAVNSITSTSNGAALFTVTDTVPETVTFTATVGGVELSQHPTVTFVSPPAAAGGISADPTTVNANGTDTTTITVTLQDAGGHPSPGKVVALSQGNGSAIISGATATTDATGRVQFTARDSFAETIAFTATDITDGDLPIPGTATVNFVNASGFCAAPGHYGLGTAAAGYSVTTFASGFPNDCFANFGPSGVTFDAQGNLLVANDPGFLYKFGPDGGAATIAYQVNATPILGGGLRGLAFTRDGRLYLAHSGAHQVVELDPATGSVLRKVVDFGSPLALAVDPLSGDLFVSNFDGVQRISNFANGPGTLTPYFAAGFTDGMVFAPDGTLYVKSGCCPDFVARVNGTNTANPGAATIIAYVDDGDGMALEANPADASKPFLYVNRTNGTITRIDTSALPDPPTAPCGAPCTDIYTGGTRGDFVTVGPDACLYATQSERIIKLAKADGSCSFLPVTPLPQIVLTPQAVAPSPALGTPTTFTATLRNVASPAGVPVTLAVIGANPQVIQTATDGAGQATFTYSGVSTGDDRVVALASLDGSALTSNTATVAWLDGKHTTFLNLNATPLAGTLKAPVAVIATLVDVTSAPAAAVNGATVHFDLGGKTCTATTNAKGTASCSVTPNAAPGAYPLTANFAGTPLLLPSSSARTVDLFARLFDAAKLWVGVEKASDHTTPFDVEVRVYNSLSDPLGSFVGRGLIRCVTGLKPNPSGAKPIIVTLDPAASEPLAVRVFARVGTKSTGAACVANHTGAAGLRLYDDAIAQPSQVFNQAGPTYLSTSTLYLHARTGANLLDTNAPKGRTPSAQDGAPVNFSQSCAPDGANGLCPDGHNPWQQIGTGWSQ